MIKTIVAPHKELNMEDHLSGGTPIIIGRK
jgi:hypothetical protein